MNVNGFTLKAVKKFKGHEGEPCFQGNIYIDNLKVGWFSSSYTMGPMDIRFDKPEIEQLFIATAAAFDKAYPMGFLYYNAQFKLDPKYKDFVNSVDAEDLILEMLSIAEAEKDYKSCLKNSQPLLVYTYGDGKTTGYSFNEIVPEPKLKHYFKQHKNQELILYVDSLSVFDVEV